MSRLKSRPSVGVPSRALTQRKNLSSEAEFDRLILASDHDLVELTTTGIVASVIVILASRLQVQPSEFGEWIGLSRATLARRLQKKGRLNLVASDRVVRYTQLWKQAVHVWGSEEAAREWLTTPEPALGGAKPLEFAVTEVGSRHVEDLMGQIAHGIST